MTPDETPRIIEPEALAAARGRLEASIRLTKPKYIFPITREDAEVLLSCAAREGQLAVLAEALRRASMELAEASNICQRQGLSGMASIFLTASNVAKDRALSTTEPQEPKL